MDRFISLTAAIMAIDGRMVARSARRNAVLFVILLFLFMSSYVSGVIALAIYLAEIFGPLGAALTVAIASLTLAIFVLAYAMLMNRAERRRYRAAKYATEEMLEGVLGVVPVMMKQKPISGLTAVAGLAFVLARAFQKK
ncbi:hypothetical protein [Martelella radicis]|uniref:MFS family permease n=1 Tax=Martelella radicis TaxID=1397476 RepID=A0A7W6KKV9_9HYPH|nr:hypothetical protein [Martelella radicis]MBB4123002.1 MFS family permease [Martelella radicis]